MTGRLASLAALVVLSASAGAFEIGERVAVTSAHGDRVFHHLGGSGRSHVAAVGGTVAVAWEDSRSGKSEVYTATMRDGEGRFAREERLSTGGEAFEPAVAALGDGRFLVAWEEGGRTWLRVMGPAGPGPVAPLGTPGSRQATLAAGGPGTAHAAWVEAAAAGQRVLYARIQADGGTGGPSVSAPTPVDPVPAPVYQAYPGVAGLADGAALVAWEDRRHGHTRIYVTRAAADGTVGPARWINEYRAPPAEGGETAKLGSGVMRPVLASADRVLATWLDKRDIGAGYAVWGATSRDGGASFGANEKIQDDSGGSDAVPHWNLTTAGHPGGMVVVAWDDAREAWSDPEETGDVYLTWNAGGGWSGDRVVKPASGPGRQAQPSVALDEAGHLHLVWVEQAGFTSPTRLWYARGVFGKGQ
ncbi:MAG: hypothetical protein MUF66_12790 [Gammaproteobacteria bacterium]|nr:hypothetical protein [Gammaproteobacteria bacterium]